MSIMLKKIILFVLVLFLAVPAAFADDSSIIPVLWLFKHLDNSNKIEEFRSYYTDTLPLKTFILKGNTVEEFRSYYTDTLPLKTFILN